MFILFFFFSALTLSVHSNYSNTVLSNRILINKISTNHLKSKQKVEKNNFKLLGMDLTENYFVYRDPRFIAYVDCRKQIQYHFFYDNPVSKKKIYLKYNKKFGIEPRKFKSVFVQGKKVIIDDIPFEINFLNNNRIFEIFNTFEGKRYLLIRRLLGRNEKINLEKIIPLESGWIFILKKQNEKQKINRELFFIHKKQLLNKKFALLKKNNYLLNGEQKSYSYQKIIFEKKHFTSQTFENFFYLSGAKKINETSQ